METKIELNSLEFLAIKYYETNITDKEIRIEDITNLFLEELEKMIEKKELINIAIIGQVVKGKSTVMMKIANIINHLIGKEMKLEYICADQYEFGRKVLEEMENICLGVDEYSALEETGWNATIEAKWLEQFSDVQAQRFIHRASCSPRKIIDENASIIIEVIEKDTKTKTTVCLIYFKRTTPMGQRIQLIGSIRLYVGDIIETEWYSRYRKRKFEKMDLINKEGIYQTRHLYFAPTIMSSYESLVKLSIFGRPTKNIIETRIKRELQERKIPISTLAVDHLRVEVQGLIEQKATIDTYKRKIANIKGKITLKQEATSQIKEAEEQLNKDIKRYQRIIEIGKKYMAI